MHDPQDRLSRADLALVLKSAAERQARRPADDDLTLAEAERIATEVGIEPAELRAAIRELRSSRPANAGFFGPHGVISSERSIGRAVDGEEAVQMLAHGQLSIPTVSGEIISPSPGVWRLSQGGSSLLQVSSRGGETTIAAAVDRRMARIGMMTGGTFLGSYLGMTVMMAIAMSTRLPLEVLALGNLLGMVGGAGGGFVGGRAAWKSMARRTHDRALAALDRMRGVMNDDAVPTEAVIPPPGIG